MAILANKSTVCCSRRCFKQVTPVRSVQRIATPRRHVAARFFKFGKNGLGSKDAGIYGSQSRDDYAPEDVEFYFNYMGMLAVEGTYDNMYAMMKDLAPVDALLLFACKENDAPKVEELLKAGADINVKDPNGLTAMEVATKPDVLEMLKKAGPTA